VLGLSQGIQARLRAERDAAVQGSSGRSLVLAKAGVVEAEMAKLGLRFRTRNPAEPLVDPAAYDAGRDAGQRFEARQALETERH